MHTLPRRSLLLATLAAAGAGAAESPPPLRIGLTPVFLDNQVTFLNHWRAYLAQQIGRPVQFVQRGSYRDVVGLLQQGGLDFAWLCGYPFVRYGSVQMKLLVVPLYRARPVYQSYLIVPARDTITGSLIDLRGRVFAFSDPDSNSGHLYTLYTLTKVRESPSRFFARSFFTWGHRKVVEAVAVGLAQGGAVDGYVWDTLDRLHPELTGRTRIVERSPEFGFPPFVARAGVPAAEFESLQRVLLGMSRDGEGRALLARLNLDGFTTGETSLYDGVRAMARAVEAGG